MSEDGFFSAYRVAIIGLGLMGGSLALALRGKCAAVLGIDSDPEVLALAERQRIVDQVSASPSALLPQSDLVILAAPVRVNLELIKQLPEWHPASAVVMDLGSTKVHTMQAMQTLPARFDPIGGHPMCGKERSSLKYAEAEIYRGAPFAFTPLPRSTARARRFAEALCSLAGSVPVWLDPQTHDRWTANSSHLPYLVANSLAGVTPLEVAPMVGTGFRSTTRLSPSGLGMMLDILATNRDNVLENLHRYIERLQQFEQCLDTGDEEGLKNLLIHGAERYDEILKRLDS